MQIAERLKKIPPYLFMELRQSIEKAKKDGKKIINLAIGDPVESTPQEIVNELIKTAKISKNHRYPTDEEKGMLLFREEISKWYLNQYNVVLDPSKEIISLIGSKEGCHHFVLGLINPCDIVLITNPGYPAYKASIILGDAEVYSMPIKLKNNFFPIFEDIPTNILLKTKAMFLNYPNNPTGACANKNFLTKAVNFAKKYNIIICYDNPYSEIVFNGQEKISILNIEGAKDVAIELNSFSKMFNMTGWRIGMAVGNSKLISAMSKVKENTDSGIFNAIQYAAIYALKFKKHFIKKMINIYEKRRKLVMETFKKIGVNHKFSNGTFYLWIPILNKYNLSSIEFTKMLFEKTAVLVTPGSSYGSYGEGFIRISLTVQDELLQEAMIRIEKLFI